MSIWRKESGPPLQAEKSLLKGGLLSVVKWLHLRARPDRPGQHVTIATVIAFLAKSMTSPKKQKKSLVGRGNFGAGVSTSTRRGATTISEPRCFSLERGSVCLCVFGKSDPRRERESANKCRDDAMFVQQRYCNLGVGETLQSRQCKVMWID